MPPPPPPPPPGLGPPPPPTLSSGGSKGGAAPNRSALLDQIHQGARLKKAVTNDRSAPQVAAVKSTGGAQERGGGGGGNAGGSHAGGGHAGGGHAGGGAPALGGLFAGGMPKLKSAGQARVPGGAGGPALKPPGSTSNGPVNAPNAPQNNDKGRLINGGPPPPPSSTNKPSTNKVVAPTGPPGLGRPVNSSTGPSPPSNGGTPGRLNSNITNRFNSSSAVEDKSVSGSPQPNVSLFAAGLATRNTPSHSPVPKPPVSTGGQQTASATPPAPPSRPPPSNSTRPNSMVGRPLPPPPGDSGSNAVGPARPPPPPPSRAAAPPPPIRGGAPPPPPPQRTTSNVNVGGTIGRSGAPSRPVSRRASTGTGLPAPPQMQPPTGPRKSGSQSSSEDDFEARFRFHQQNEFTPPEPFSNMNKAYPSKNPRNSNRQRPPPPMPPR